MAWFACRIVVVSMVAMAPVMAWVRVMVRVMAWVPVTAMAWMAPGMVRVMAWVPVMVRVRPPGLRCHGQAEPHGHHHHHRRNRHLRHLWRLRTTGGRSRFDHWMNPIRSNRVPRRLGEAVDLDKTWLS
jgi:hypothetical protein